MLHCEGSNPSKQILTWSLSQLGPYLFLRGVPVALGAHEVLLSHRRDNYLLFDLKKETRGITQNR